MAGRGKLFKPTSLTPTASMEEISFLNEFAISTLSMVNCNRSALTLMLVFPDTVVGLNLIVSRNGIDVIEFPAGYLRSSHKVSVHKLPDFFSGMESNIATNDQLGLRSCINYLDLFFQGIQGNLNFVGCGI